MRLQRHLVRLMGMLESLPGVFMPRQVILFSAVRWSWAASSWLSAAFRRNPRMIPVSNGNRVIVATKLWSDGTALAFC
jgi:hypothetical protein